MVQSTTASPFIGSTKYKSFPAGDENLDQIVATTHEAKDFTMNERKAWV